MNLTYKDIIVKILMLSGYPHDTEKFATRFEELNYEEALANSIEQLPYEIQKQIRMCNNNHEQIRQLMPQELYAREFLKVSSSALTNLLEDLAPSLQIEQRTQIAKLIASQQPSSLPLQA